MPPFLVCQSMRWTLQQAWHVSHPFPWLSHGCIISNLAFQSHHQRLNITSFLTLLRYICQGKGTWISPFLLLLWLPSSLSGIPPNMLRQPHIIKWCREHSGKARKTRWNPWPNCVLSRHVLYSERFSRWIQSKAVYLLLDCYVILCQNCECLPGQ